jgi:hypothetical protein
MEDAVETKIEMCWRRGDISRCLAFSSQTGVGLGPYKHEK